MYKEELGMSFAQEEKLASQDTVAFVACNGTLKQTLESFEAMNLEYENLYNEDDERREYNSVWYS